MSLSSWHPRRKKSSPGAQRERGRRPSRAAFARFLLEGLEERSLLSTITWINTKGGDWDTAANWKGGVVPGPNDNAVISIAGITVTHNSNVADSVNSLTSTAAISIGAGSLSLGSSSKIANTLSVAGGNFSASGPVSLNSLLWSVGTMSGMGTVTVVAGGTTTLRANSTRLLDGLTFDNLGPATWTGSGNLDMADGAVWNNMASGTFNDRGTGTIVATSGATPSFNNAGTFEVTAPSTGISVQVPFTNTGTVSVQTGSITFDSSVSTTGKIATSGGSTVEFNGDQVALGDGSSFAGDGLTSLTNATITVTGSSNISNFAMSGGTLTGPGSLSVSNTTNLSGGGTISMAGLLTIDGTLTISGTVFLNGATLDDYASTTMDGDLYFDGNATFNNEPGNTFNINGNSQLVADDSNAGNFNNWGTLEVTAGTATSIGVNGRGNGGGFNFNQAGIGSLEVLSGNVDFHESSSFAGNTTIAAGSAVMFDSGQAAFGDGSSFTGDGLTSLTNATITVTGSSNISNFAMSGGTLTGPGSLSVSNTTNLSGGGTISMAGLLTIDGTLTISGTVFLNGATLDDYASTTMDGDLYFDGNATFNNEPGNTFNINGNSQLVADDSNAGNFNNWGTLEVTAGTATSIGVNGRGNGGGFNFNQAGIGSLEVLSGNVDFHESSSFAGNTTIAAGSAVMFDSGQAAFGDGSSFTGDGLTSLTNATITVTGSSNISNFAMSGGTLTGPGSLTTDNLTWTGGTMTGTGTTIALSSMTLGSSAQGYYSLNLNGRELDNYGTATLATPTQDYGLYMGGGALLVNEPGASFNILDSAQIQADAYDPTGIANIDNLGVFTKADSTGTTYVGQSPFGPGYIAFNEQGSGSLNIESGELQLDGGGSLAGSGLVTVDSDATLSFGRQAFVIGAGSSIGGTGTVEFAGGTVDDLGNANPDTAQALTVVIDGGEIDFDGSSPVTVVSLVESGGTLGGATNLSVATSLTWTGGTMTGTGTTIALSSMTLGSSAQGYYSLNLNGRELDNYGTATLATPTQDYGLYMGGGALLVNEPGASFNILDSAQIQADAYDPTGIANIDNLGVFTKADSTGTTYVGQSPFGPGYIAFNEQGSGSLNIESGELQLDGGGSLAGSGLVTVDSDATLSFGRQAFVIGAGSSIGGTGTVEFAGGTVDDLGNANPDTAQALTVVIDGGEIDFDGSSPVTVVSLVESGGTLGGATNLSVATSLTWTGGTMTGTGTTIALSSMTLGSSAQGYYSLNLNGRELDNYGTATLATPTQDYGLYMGGGALLVNEPGASFNILDSAQIQADAYDPTGIANIDNLGVFTKADSTGTTYVGQSPFGPGYIAFNEQGSGSLNIESGELQLDGGGSLAGSGLVTVDSDATLSFGRQAFVIGAGSSIGGTGTVEFAGGTVDDLGNANPDTAQALTVVIDGGEIDFDGSSPVTVVSLVESGGTLGGATNLSVATSLTWTGGTMTGTGTTIALSSMTLGSSAQGYYSLNLNGRELDNYGTATLATPTQDYGLYMGGGALLVNEPGASFNILDSAQIQADAYDPTGIANIDNLGVFTKADSTGTTYVGQSPFGPGYIAFNEQGSGSLNIESGELQLDGGGSSTDKSSFNTSNGGMLFFPSGSQYSFGGITAITGDGVYIQGATISINGSVSATDLEFDSGTLMLTGASTLTAVDFDWVGGQITGSGQLTVTGTLSLPGNPERDVAGWTLNTDGTVDLATPGLTSVSQGGAWNNGGTFDWTGAGDLQFTNASFTNSGTMTLNGLGAMTLESSSFSNSGTLALETSNTFQLASSSWTNSGSLNWAGLDSIVLDASNWSNSGDLTWRGAGDLELIDTSTITNQPSGTLTVTDDQGIPLENMSQGSSFENDGSFIETGASGVLAIEVPWVNDGAVTVDSGTLSIQGSGSDSSAEPMQAMVGAVLDFDSLFSTATFTIAAGSAGITGAGTASFSGGIVDDFGAYDVGNTLINGGSLLIEGTGTTGTLALASGTLGGLGTFTVTGTTVWTGGAMSGTGSMIAEGDITIGSPDSDGPMDLTGFTLVNSSLMIVAGDGLVVGGGGMIENPAGATFDFESDASIATDSAGGTFVNEGTLVKSEGTGLSGIGPVLTNSGTVLAESGTLSIDGGGTDTSSVAMAAAPGATLDFGNGNTPEFSVTNFEIMAGSAGISAANGTISFGYQEVTIDAGSGGVVGGSTVIVQGALVTENGPYDVGTTVVSDGEINFSGTVTTGSLTVSGGIVSASGSLIVTGTTNLTGGEIDGPGTITAMGLLTIGQSGTDDSVSVGAGTLQIDGSATLAGDMESALSVGEGANIVIPQDGSFTIVDDAGIAQVSVEDPGTIINNGLFVKAGGTGISDAGALVDNFGTVEAQSGTISFQVGGTGESGSEFNASAGATVSFDGGTFTLNGGTSLTGDGTVFLTDTVDRTLTSPAHTIVDLNGPVQATNFDEESGTLTGSGDLTVTGTLTVNGGVMDGTGVTEVAPGGFLANVSVMYAGLRTINNDGTALAAEPYSSFVSTGATYSALAGYLESALSTIASQAANEITSNPVPLLGTGDASTYLNQVIGSFDAALTAAIGQNGVHLAAIQTALFDALGPQGLNLLESPDVTLPVEPSDVEIFDYQGSVFFGMDLASAGVYTSRTGFNIGVPGLPFSLSDTSGIQVQTGYSVELQFQVSQYAGGTPAPLMGFTALNVGVNATAPGLNISGKLGPLQVQVQDDPSNPSSFIGTYGVTVSTDSDGNITAQTNLYGSADVNLLLSASFGVTQTIDPRLSADFHLGWTFTNADPTTTSSFGDLPDIEFNSVTLDLGSFLDSFIAPVVSEIQQFTEQFQPIVAFLTSDVPVLSTLTEDAYGSPVTFADLIEQYLGDSSGINEFLSFINTINTFSVTSLAGGINLGSFQLTSDLRQGDWDSETPTSYDTTDATDPDAELSDSTTVQQLTGMGVDFPFLDNPYTILNLFLNPSVPVNLVSWDLPKLDADFEYEQDAEVAPGVYVQFFGGLDAQVAATIGFNTSGFQTGNLLDGFTITGGLTDADGNPAFAELTVSGGGGAGLGAAYGGTAVGVSLDVIFSGSLFFGFNGQDSSGTIAVDQIDTNDPLVMIGPPEIDVELDLVFQFGDYTQKQEIAQGRLWPLPFE